MKISTVLVCSAALLGWLFTSPLQAQEPGVASVGGGGGWSPFAALDTRFMTRTDIGDGRGYDSGYQTINAFQPLFVTPDSSLFWINPQGFVQFNGDFGANVGGGYRYFEPSTGIIFGAGAWYDHDRSTTSSYDQVGLSLEVLGDYLDFRTNVYLPTDEDPNTAFSALNGFASLTGFNVGLQRLTVLERGLGGADFEVGGAVPGLGDIGIRPYAGMYYLDGKNIDGEIGFKARIEALVTEDLIGEVGVSDDEFFGTRVTGALTWYFGSGRPPRFFNRQPNVNRLYTRQERQYRIAIHRETVVRTSDALINPATGLPFRVLSVDNTAPAGGIGTAESPLNFLPGSAPGFDIVYVNSGNGTPSNQNTGITLFNNQRLLGEGIAHTLIGTQQSFLLVGDTTGAFPVIGNPGGNAVTLANNNEVAGLNIDGALNGIAGLGITNANIHDMTIRNTTRGMLFANAFGTNNVNDVTFRNNGLASIQISSIGSAPLTFNADTILSSGGVRGLDILTSGSTVTANVTNSSFASTGADIRVESVAGGTGNLLTSNLTSTGSGRGVDLLANGATVNASVANSILLNHTSAIRGEATNGGTVNVGLSSLVVSNSTFGFDLLATQNGTVVASDLNSNYTNIGTTGIRGIAQAPGSLLNLSLNGTTVTGSGRGLDLLANNTTVLASTLNATFNGNGNGARAQVLAGGLLNYSTTGSSYLNSTGGIPTGNGLTLVNSGSTLNFSSVLDTYNGNTNNGIGGTGTAAAIRSNSTIFMNTVTANNNRADGFNFALNGSDGTFTIINSTLNLNGSDGIDISAINNSTVTTNFLNNTTTMSQNTNNGVFLSFNNSRYLSSNIINNVIGQNRDAGFRLDLINGSRANNLVMRNNVVDSNLNFGFLLNSDNSSGNFLFDSNTYTRNGDAAIAAFFIGTPTLASNFVFTQNAIGTSFNGTDARGNGQGLLIDLRNTNTINLAMTNNDIGGNATDGVNINQLENATLNANFTSNRAGTSAANGLANGNDGIRLTRGTSGPQSIVLRSNNLSGNGGDGFDSFSTGGPPTQIYTLTNNTYNGNGLSGVHITAQANARIQFDVTNETMTNNGLFGFNHDQAEVGILQGTWNNILASGNRGGGVNLEGNSDITINNSIISDNPGGDGLSYTGATFGDLVLNNVRIERNTAGRGIFLQNLIGGTATLNNSFVRFNGGTGIDITVPGAGGAVTLNNSEVRFNAGRGISMVAPVGGSGFGATLTIQGGSTVSSNTNTGVFIEADNNGLNTTGGTLRLVALNSTFVGNGQVGGSEAAGTSGGIVFRQAATQGGSMSANIQDNTLNGNFGADLFISGITPSFDLGDTPADPKIRYNFVFANNQIQDIQANPTVNNTLFYDTGSAAKSPVPPNNVNTRRRNATRANLANTGDASLWIVSLGPNTMLPGGAANNTLFTTIQTITIGNTNEESTAWTITPFP